MSWAVERLSELTQYVEELAKVVERPFFRSTQYTSLYLEEGQLKDLPGTTIGGDEDVWLTIERLMLSQPPDPPGSLKPWITLSTDPNKPPTTKDHVVITLSAEEAEKWVAVGRVSREDLRQRAADSDHGSQVDVFLRLKAFPELQKAIREYVEGPWSAWSAKEKAVRATKVVYEKLFSLQKAIEAGTLSKPLEIMWGAGMLHWKHPQVGLVHHPLIEIPVELLIDPETAAVTIRPVGRQPRLAENLISAVTLEGSANLLSKASKFLSQGESGIISPFAPDTFIPLLKFVTTHLDPEGEFYPGPVDDTRKQTLGDSLTVTTTWAIYARPRTENFIIEDLRKQREKLELRHSDGEPLPGVLKKLMRLESDTITPPPHPSPSPPGTPPRPESEFFLPKAHNEEQIEIIRKLDALDQAGAVVQGPPGTGKTHTIANIICHFLATGRRVLVASHSEGALNVLREQIPEGIRDLTVSILTSEREGIEQLEKAVRQIEQVTSSSSPVTLAAEIEKQSTICIDCRQKLSAIDNQLKQFAQLHLGGLGGLAKRAWEWAEMVVKSAGTHSWLPDCISSAQKPLFGEEHIDQLREARRVLGSEIALVNAKLPSLGDLPDPTTVASIHADILTHKRLSTELSGGQLPSLSVHHQSGEECAKACLRALEAVIAALRVVQEAPWLKNYLTTQNEAPSIIEALFEKISALAKRRLIVLNSAVSVPAEVFLLGVVSEIEIALDRVISGNKPFTPFKGKKIKELFSEIVVEGHKLEPSSSEQAIKVKEYLGWRSDVDSFVVTWNTVAGELGFPSIENGAGVGRWLSDMAAWTDKLRAAKSQAVPLLEFELPKLFPSESGIDVSQIVRNEASANETLNVVTANLTIVRLKSALQTVTAVSELLREHSGGIVDQLAKFVSSELGEATKAPSQISEQWKSLLDELQRQLERNETVQVIRRVSELVRNSGAPLWANKTCSEPPVDGIDAWTPKHWQQSWRWRQADSYLRSINKHSELKQLSLRRQQTLDILQRATNEEVRLRTTLELTKRLDDESRGDLAMVVSLLGGIGAGTGKQAAFLRRDAQQAMERCYSAVPCWIMPSWRVSEMLPSEPYSFDLVIIDEASQSDIRELPVVLRGAKILIVGDDKQVSPSAIGIPINKIELLSHRFLKDQPFGPLMRPGFSLYDLFLSVFAGQKTMLREHFRCVEPIIRFSFQFYEQKIEPLRIPHASERLDPPLIDVYLKYGHKEKNKTNPAEAGYIVEEIDKLIKAPNFGKRSIGIISLLGSHQAALIEKLLLKRIGETEILKHNIVAGDAATFQGKERDIMFVSMVSSPNDFRKVVAKQYKQRFNVAFSRAKDRIYLVRSLDLDDLDPEDLKAKVIMHFQNPMRGSSAKAEKARALCESDFEREVYDGLLAEGYAVTPQVAVGGYRIDLVIEGGGDRRLAVELDGEKWHGPDRWWADYRRQLALERMGWTFWRCWGSDWRLERAACLDDLRSVLDAMGIHSGHTSVQAHQYTEHRVLSEAPTSEPEVSLSADESCAELGDAVEIEFSEQDPPNRATYLLSLDGHNPDNGVVRVDTPLGQVLLGAAVGDDLQFPGTNENAIVIGVFKGGGETPTPTPETPTPTPTAYSLGAQGLSLH